MEFIDREEIVEDLYKLKKSKKYSEILISGESGVGKTELLKKAFLNNNAVIIEETFSNYFRKVVEEFVQKGFHDYLFDLSNCNYKDIYIYKFKNAIPGSRELADFIIQTVFNTVNTVLNTEDILADFVANKEEIEFIIFDGIEKCAPEDYARILKFKNSLFSKHLSKKLTFIYAADPSNHSDIYKKLSLTVKEISLNGLETLYIQQMVRDLVKNENLECKKLAEYLHVAAKGKPGAIIALIRNNIDLDNATGMTQTEILNKIKKPNFDCFNSIEKAVMLYVCVNTHPVSREKLAEFLAFHNLDNEIIDYTDSIKILTDKELFSYDNGKLAASEIIKELFCTYAKKELKLVYLIYNYQKANKMQLRYFENADFLKFVYKSEQIMFDDDLKKEFFECVFEAGCKCFEFEELDKSVEYFKNILTFNEYITEEVLVCIMKANYYCANYSEIESIILSQNDEEYKSYEYWYWKGNVLYMLNNPKGIDCFKKAIALAKNDNDKIYSQLMFNMAISENPEQCVNTLKNYKQIIEEHKDKNLPALAALYRNSLVLGGDKTIAKCNEGIQIAEKLNSQEELVKLHHNKHFELFRMGRYDGCEEAFRNSANYFQDCGKRIYESAYGFNNLALLSLVNGELEKAELYALSATIFSGTPYSAITTLVNATQIFSQCKNKDYDIDDYVEKIERLIVKFKINDNRIYRKSYFSIAIAYINRHKTDKAIEYVRKAEPFMESGNHLNRYYNLCKKLNIPPKVIPENIITMDDGYYNFYSNPEYELWALAYGHI